MSYQDTVTQLQEIMSPLLPWSGGGVEEICINGPGEAFIRYGGKFHRYDVDLDFDDLYDIAVLSGDLRKQTVGESSPIVGADIPFGGNLQRLQSMLPPIVPSATVSHTIRRFETEVAPTSLITSRYNTARWNQWQKRNDARQQDFAHVLAAFDGGDIDAFLSACIELRMNVLFSGSTGAGKTTLARSVLSLVDMEERIITIEDALELVIRQPNCVRLLYSKGSLSADNVTAKDLLEASLRMRPTRIILQELRDPEAAYVYVNEGLTGHRGSLTTIHGGSASEAFRRLFTLVKGSEQGRAYGDSMIMDLLVGAVDVIIPLKNTGSEYAINEVYFAADAARRGETARNLMGG